MTAILNKLSCSFLTVALALLAMTACNDDMSELGMSTMPDEEKITSYHGLELVSVSGAFRDSMYIRTGYPLVGNIIDPAMGKVTAGYMAQFYASKNIEMTEYTSTPTNQDSATFNILRTSVMNKDWQYGLSKLDPKGIYTPEAFKARGMVWDSIINNQIDSMTIRIYYQTYYGDSLAPQQLTVYQLPDNVKLDEEPNSHFYNGKWIDKAMDEYCQEDRIIGRRAFTAANRVLSDSVRATGSYLPYIEIKISDELKEKFLHASVEASIKRDKQFGGRNTYPEYDDIFSNIADLRENWMSGVAVKSTFGSGCLVKVYNTAVYFFYRSYHKYDKDGTLLRNPDDTKDSSYVVSHVQYMAVTPDVVQMSHVTSEIDVDKNKLIEGFKMSEITGYDNNNQDSCNIIVSPQGFYTNIDLPVGKIMRRIMDRVSPQDSGYFLNGANFALMCEKPKGDLFLNIPPKNVLMVQEENMNSFFESRTLTDSTISVASYVADSVNNKIYYYNFGNITSLITSVAHLSKNGGWEKGKTTSLEWAKKIQATHPKTFMPGKTITEYNDEVKKALDNYTIRMAIVPVDITQNTTYGTVLSVSNYVLPSAIFIRKQDMTLKDYITSCTDAWAQGKPTPNIDYFDDIKDNATGHGTNNKLIQAIQTIWTYGGGL